MTGRQVQPRNYPVTQQTGRQGELWVESFFTDAGWTVGTYHIDDGYDLFVTPPRAEFDGQSFLVQVKGKAKRQKRGVVAPVSRKRLRDYAANVTPVFIFQVGFLDSCAERDQAGAKASYWQRRCTSSIANRKRSSHD